MKKFIVSKYVRMSIEQRQEPVATGTGTGKKANRLRFELVSLIHGPLTLPKNSSSLSLYVPKFILVDPLFYGVAGWRVISPTNSLVSGIA